MSFELKPGADILGLPAITLGGETLYVARLPLRRVLELVQLRPQINAVLAALPAMADKAIDFTPLIDWTLAGLLPLYPTLTREELLDYPIDIDELLAALPIIAAQGSSRRAPATGETVATSGAPTTGADSSPTSSST